MRIVACYKYVLDERDIRVNPETRSLVTERAAWKLSDYDRNAIEEAVRLKEEHPGIEAVGLTAGSVQAKASLKEVLARGLDAAYFVQEEALAGADPAVVARVRARAVEKIGDCRLVLCGEGASDDYAQQVGPRLAVLLGWPVITYVSRLALVGEVVRAARNLEDGTETVEVDLPAVVTVTGEINQPRIPTLKQVMAAGRKPMHVWSLQDLGLTSGDLSSPVKVVSVQGAVSDRKRVVFKGEPAAAVAELVEALVKEGLI